MPWSQELEFYHVEIDNLYEEVVENLKKLKFIKVERNGRIVLTFRLLRILTKLKVGIPSII